MLVFLLISVYVRNFFLCLKFLIFQKMYNIFRKIKTKDKSYKKNIRIHIIYLILYNSKDAIVMDFLLIKFYNNIKYCKFGI